MINKFTLSLIQASILSTWLLNSKISWASSSPRPLLLLSCSRLLQEVINCSSCARISRLALCFLESSISPVSIQLSHCIFNFNYIMEIITWSIPSMEHYSVWEQFSVWEVTRRYISCTQRNAEGWGRGGVGGGGGGGGEGGGERCGGWEMLISLFRPIIGIEP